MFEFDENSTLVVSWVRSISNGSTSRDKVPNLGNLQAVVYALLDKKEEEGGE